LSLLFSRGLAMKVRSLVLLGIVLVFLAVVGFVAV
jgi:hypothetical protein